MGNGNLTLDPTSEPRSARDLSRFYQATGRKSNPVLFTRAFKKLFSTIFSLTYELENAHQILIPFLLDLVLVRGNGNVVKISTRSIHVVASTKQAKHCEL